MKEEIDDNFFTMVLIVLALIFSVLVCSKCWIAVFVVVKPVVPLIVRTS